MILEWEPYPPFSLKQANFFNFLSASSLMSRFETAGNMHLIVSARTSAVFWSNILSCLLHQLLPGYSGIPRAHSSFKTAAEMEKIQKFQNVLKIVSEMVLRLAMHQLVITVGANGNLVVLLTVGSAVQRTRN